MFAGLDMEDESGSESEDEQEEEVTTESNQDSEKAAASAAAIAAETIYGGIDPDDLEITIETLRAVAADITLFRSKPFKGLREAIGPLARELVGSGGGGGGGGKGGGRGGGNRRGEKSTRLEGLSPEERMKQMDRDALNHRVLRAERLERLEQMSRQEAADDGERLRLQLSGGALIDPNAALNADQGASLVPFSIPDGPACASVNEGAEPPKLDPSVPSRLNFAKSCYICKRPYRDLHAFYAALCPECAELNWRKRGETCNLYGRVALCTGARVKIGLRIGLKLLRCGCTLIATTRFPTDAVRRYMAEPDSHTWAHRLHIIGCDLRDLKGLEALCDALQRMASRLDIIVNNACQTVRRPPQYYLPLLEAEKKVAPAEEARLRQWTAAHSSINRARQLLHQTSPAAAEAEVADMSSAEADVKMTHHRGAVSAPPSHRSLVTPLPDAPSAEAEGGIVPGMTLSVGGAGVDSALLSQLAVVPGDETRDDAAFPKGRTDGNSDLGQQLDLRQSNSWMLKLEDVSTPEMAEVLAINALAPAVINGRLRKLMEASGVPDEGGAEGTAEGGAEGGGEGTNPPKPADHSLKFIVNVSAMEGRFYK